MTDEEMAEQYAKLNARQYIRNDGIGFCTSEEEVKQAFLAGLEAGKDMNVPIKWHDLRKDSKDLPKEDNWYQVSVYSQIEGKKKSGLHTTTAFYDTDKNEWQTKDYGFCQRDGWINANIRAWCEIPTYKEE